LEKLTYDMELAAEEDIMEWNDGELENGETYIVME
jgi:hypothetical protein